MSAYEIPGFVFSMMSSGLIRQYHAVILGNGVVTEVAGADAKISGVAQMPAASATPETIRIMNSGITKMIAGDTVTAGNELVTDSSGRAVPDTSDTNLFGRALTGGAVGEEITVLLY